MGKTRKDSKNRQQNNFDVDGFEHEDQDDEQIAEIKPRQPRKVISPMTKEAISMVNYYCDTILPGYTDENWYNAARCLKVLGEHLDIETYRTLGSLMSEMYAGPSTDRVSEVRKAVIAALQNQ